VGNYGRRRAHAAAQQGRREVHWHGPEPLGSKVGDQLRRPRVRHRAGKVLWAGRMQTCWVVGGLALLERDGMGWDRMRSLQSPSIRLLILSLAPFSFPPFCIPLITFFFAVSLFRFTQSDWIGSCETLPFLVNRLPLPTSHATITPLVAGQ
jgi:hypothetical protein